MQQWRRWLMQFQVLAPALGLVLVLGGCSTTPFEILMPSGEVLKGGVSTTASRGSFYATNGKVTCTGPFRPEIIGHAVDLSMSCSDSERGDGQGEELPSGGGQGKITLKTGRTATFRYGEAAKSP